MPHGKVSMAGSTYPQSVEQSDADAIQWRPLALLTLLAIGMVAPAVYFALRYPLAEHVWELTDLGRLSNYTTSSFQIFVSGLLVWFALYIGGYLITRRCNQQIALVIILAAAAIAGLFLVAMYPVNATDMHMYAARSRLFTEYGFDPIAVTPNAVPNDEWRRLVSGEWASHTSPYGPLWTLIAAPITALAGDHLLRALLGFKLLALNAVLATGWLIAKGAAREPASRPAAAALLFVWNPLVLWEGIGNGHNDTVVALFLVASVVAWRYQRLAWVIPILVAAVLLKYVALILLPLAAIAVGRQARANGSLRRTTVQTVILSTLVVIGGLAPFYDIGAIRESISTQGRIYATSPASLAIKDLAQITTEPTAVRLVQAIGLLALCAVGLLWLWRVGRHPQRLPDAMFAVVFVFLLLATLNFRSWYLIWLVALAGLATSRWAAARVMAWTAGAMAAYPVLIWIWGWEGYTFQRVEQIVVLLMFGPPVVVSLLALGSPAFDRLFRRTNGPQSRRSLKPAVNHGNDYQQRYRPPEETTEYIRGPVRAGGNAAVRGRYEGKSRAYPDEDASEPRC